VNLEEVDLGPKFWDFLFKLVLPLFVWPEKSSKRFTADLFVEAEAIGSVNLLADSSAFFLCAIRAALLFLPASGRRRN
jgi:hypothetical protein